MPSILFFRKATKTFTYLSGNEKDIYKAKWKSWISEISDKGLLASQKNLSNDGVLVSGKDQDVRYKPYMDDNEDLVTSYLIIETTNQQYDFIFAGPPYALGTIDDLPLKIFEHKILKPKGWFVLEHTPRNNYKKFEHYKTERNYGTTIFSIFIQP